MNIEWLLSMLSGSIKQHSRGLNLHSHASSEMVAQVAAGEVPQGEVSARAAAAGKACWMLPPEEARALQVASCVQDPVLWARSQGSACSGYSLAGLVQVLLFAQVLGMQSPAQVLGTQSLPPVAAQLLC